MDEVKLEAETKQRQREQQMNDQRQYASILQRQKQDRLNQAVRVKQEDKVFIE